MLCTVIIPEHFTRYVSWFYSCYLVSGFRDGWLCPDSSNSDNNVSLASLPSGLADMKSVQTKSDLCMPEAIALHHWSDYCNCSNYRSAHSESACSGCTDCSGLWYCCLQLPREQLIQTTSHSTLHFLGSCHDILPPTSSSNDRTMSIWRNFLYPSSGKVTFNYQSVIIFLYFKMPMAENTKCSLLVLH